MQNWNQWQLPAGAITTTSMPQPPVGYAAAGADPMAMMQAYMQYYNQPAPSGYTAEQWATAQQQSWAQWQQWQQQYQQWQAQYGEKYQETMKQMSQSMSAQVPSLPAIPPLPKEDFKPPLPPNTTNTYQFTSMPPPHQNNLPLFPAKQFASNPLSQSNSSSYPQNPPLPATQPPLPPENPQSNDDISGGKRASNNVSESSSAKKLKLEDEEELTEAEKTFDAQFKQWEEQFNKWKQQNANHPDKTQYKQYEAKWTSWREKLIERREQMRKKREQQKQLTGKMENEKNKNLPGGDKIMNILSSTENQGLINNLLGIGKTLGLTGKQGVPPPPPPPPQTSGVNAGTTTVSSQQAQSQLGTDITSSSSWNNQQTSQWSTQYNTQYPGFQAPFNASSNLTHPPNFALPPPNMPSIEPNFSQPPPGFSSNDGRQISSGMNTRQGAGGRSPFGTPHNSNVYSPSGTLDQGGSNTNRLGSSYPSNFDNNSQNRVHENKSINSEYFGRDGTNRSSSELEGNQFRQNNAFASDRFSSDRFNRGEGNYKLPEGVDIDGKYHNREDRNSMEFGSNQFNAQGNDHFGRGDRFLGLSDRYGNINDRLAPGNDRFAMDERYRQGDRFGSSDNRFGHSGDRFGPRNDRFAPGFDRYGPENENDRYGRNSMGHFNQKEGDKRDLNNPRGFNRSNQYEAADELAPELKKLMEKRKANVDVFKPSFLDSDKSSSLGSLHESFKKITGESPFAPRCNSTDFIQNTGLKPMTASSPRAPGSFGSPGSVNFRAFGPRGPENFRQFGMPDFRQRCPPNFNPRNGSFDLPNNYQRNEGQFDSVKDFQNVGVPDFSSTEKKLEIPDRKDEPRDGAENLDVINKDSLNNSGTEENRNNNLCSQSSVPPLEKPPWIDVAFSEGNLPEKEGNSAEHENSTPSNFVSSVEQNTEKNREGAEAPRKSVEEETPNIIPENDSGKKLEVLPFMGENDPKPEDLNMEPPPELPNLGPISAEISSDMGFSGNQRISEGFTGNLPDGKVNPSLAFSPRAPDDGRLLPSGPRQTANFPPGNVNSGMSRPHGSTSGQFGLMGSTDVSLPRYGPRGPIDGQFNIRSPHTRPMGPWRPGDGPYDSRNMEAQPPYKEAMGFPNPHEKHFSGRRHPDGPFGSPRPSDGPNNFGPHGYDGHLYGPMDRVPFGPRNLPERQFDGRNLGDRAFGLRGPEGPFPPRSMHDEIRGYIENPYNNRGLYPPNRGNYGPRGSLGNSSTNDVPGFPPPFKHDDFKMERFAEGRGDVNLPDTGKDILMQTPGTDKPYRPDCKPPYTQNVQHNFDDINPRGQYRAESSRSDHDSDPLSVYSNKSNLPVDELEKGGMDIIGDSRSRYGDPSMTSDYNKYSPTNVFMKRAMDNRQSQMRGPTKEFCIERQFNYNHGATSKDKKYVEYVPAKIIDYAHASLPLSQEYLTPTQSFDYGHGSLKPVVPDHEFYPQKDFRHWEESEQNLKEYTERMKKYENSMNKRDRKRSGSFSDKEKDWAVSSRKFERDKKNFEEYKEREKTREERTYSNTSDKYQEETVQSDTKISTKDRGHDRCERYRTDTNREINKESDRSKGHTNWQENSNKTPVETKTSHTSTHNKQENVSDIPAKTLELTKTSNCTMVDDLLCPPGRQNRPPKIAIILRGPPGSGKSFVAKLIKDKEVEQGGSAPRILSLDDYFLVEKEIETKDDNGKKVIVKEMVYEYEEAMEPSYIASLVKAFKKNITDGFFNFIILDCINEKISDYEDMWSFAKTKGFKVYVCEMEMDVQICLKRNIHNRSEEEINRIVDYFEPTPSYHQKLDVNSMLQEQAIEEVQMEDTEQLQEKKEEQPNEESQDSQEDIQDNTGISKWERMEAEDKLDRLDGLAKKKNEVKPQTMEDFLQVPDYYNMEDTSGKKRVRWADLEERKQQEKMRAVGFVVGHTNWERMMDPTNGGSALTRTKFFSLS